MSQSYGVMEEVTLDRGKVTSENLDTYLIPTAMDIPEMKVNIFECEDPNGAYGAKSVGEPATEGVAAAIANAVYNAIGRRVREKTRIFRPFKSSGDAMERLLLVNSRNPFSPKQMNFPPLASTALAIISPAFPFVTASSAL